MKRNVADYEHRELNEDGLIKTLTPSQIKQTTCRL
jgi:hypothetical protein